jgi:hypothetical protein
MGLELFLLDRIQATALQVRETNRRLALGVGIIFFYLLVGSIIFMLIEAPYEAKYVEYFREYKAKTVQRFLDAGLKGESNKTRFLLNFLSSVILGFCRA